MPPANPDRGCAGALLNTGDVFAVNGQGAAAVVDGRLVSVNGAPLTVSPSSQFGMHPNLCYGGVGWSPNGRFLALLVGAFAPYDFNGIDTGVWVYDTATGQSWQVLRNVYEGQGGGALGEQRRALRVRWSPTSAALLVAVETGYGLGTAVVSVNADANIPPVILPYADATWTLDGAALIVSGPVSGGASVVGRVEMGSWAYTEYQNQQTNGLTMRGTAQLPDGRLAFLASVAGQESYALYVAPAALGAAGTALSGPTYGAFVAADWDAGRSAVLVTTTGGSWVAYTNGAVQTSGMANGALSGAFWRN